MRKICYVTGTRADFGLMRATLESIHSRSALELSLLVTGMHLSPKYGETWREIADVGLTIGVKVPVNLTGSSGSEMAIALGEQVIGFTKALEQIEPDIVLLLGDRGEMLAGAIAALHLNIPIVHIHGGELSGTVDESIRHAISKLSHYHFTSTNKSRERLVRMGEKPEHIFVTGAPGLDAIYKAEFLDRESLLMEYGLDGDAPFLLVLFHPVVQQVDEAENQTVLLLDAVVESEMQSLIIMPNADAGSKVIEKVISNYSKHKKIFTALHVPREKFLSLMKFSEVLIGNSSSGIIEAASLGTPVVNVGDRQQCRERNMNVIDVDFKKANICSAIQKAKKLKGEDWVNVYGDGKTTGLIVNKLLEISLSSTVLEKVNAY